jgi:hypothetical protein
MTRWPSLGVAAKAGRCVCPGWRGRRRRPGNRFGMPAEARVPAGGRWLGLGLGGRCGRGLGCRGLLLDPELMDMQPLDLQVLDLQASNHRPADRQPADRQGTDSTGANGQRPECGRTDASRWELHRRRLGPATLGRQEGTERRSSDGHDMSSLARQRSVPTFTGDSSLTIAARRAQRSLLLARITRPSSVVVSCSPGHYAGWGGDGTAGSLWPPRRARAVSRRPTAGRCVVALARPKTGMLP